jgi:ADP-ribosyl-[dinitrogen reductase] hydrolase
MSSLNRIKDFIYKNKTMDLDKLRGGFIGLALGDALGAPHELSFSVPVTKYTGVLQYPIPWKPRFQKKKYSVVGQITDDTSMSVALLRSILKNKDWVYEDILKTYLEWANSGIKFLGYNTRDLFKGIKTIRGYENRYKKKDLSNCQSNGSLMRAYPLVILFYMYPNYQEAYLKALKDTKLTNPSIINQDCTLVYLTAVLFLLKKVNPNEIVTTIYKYAQTDEVKQVIVSAIKQEERDITKQKGWVLHAIYLCVRSLLFILTYSYSSIINWIITQGGDTDTNAALVGSLLGTYLGEKKLMKEKITAKNIKVLLSADIEQGEIPIKKKYSINAALKMLV